MSLCDKGGPKVQRENESDPAGRSIDWPSTRHFDDQFCHGHDRTLGRLRTGKCSPFSLRFTPRLRQWRRYHTTNRPRGFFYWNEGRDTVLWIMTGRERHYGTTNQSHDFSQKHSSPRRTLCTESSKNIEQQMEGDGQGGKQPQS